ncbi:MAG: flagellar hook-basal body complex protein FliE [Lachnospiraceae bacterium]|jgi:flagellar hook-basal body complex protein FliE|nr:flagellar hook-basal body complex protein FliE [Lachnospiraceae bacterium]
MDITALHNVTSEYLKNVVDASQQVHVEDESFDNVLQSAMDMINEANYLQNKSEEAEMEFMLGYSTNPHALMAVQEKADIALNYTMTVKDKVLDAYKELMNMQI